MSKPILAAIFALSLTGCAILQKVTNRNPASGPFDEVNGWYNKSFVEESIVPLSESLKDEEYGAIIRDICKLPKNEEKWPKAQAASCNKKLDEMYYAQLKERYPYADPALVNQHCKAHPLECYAPKDQETVIRGFHNRETTRRYKAEVARINSHYAQQQAYQNQRMGMALQGLGRGIQDAFNPPDAVIEVRER